MADVVRFQSTLARITYTVGPDTVRRAILSWVAAEHGGSFTDDTRVNFLSEGAVTIVTDFQTEPTP